MLYCESDALSVYGANAMVASRHIRFQMQLKLTVTQKAGEYSQMTFNPHPKRYYSFTFLISFFISYVRKGADRDLNSLPSPILTTLFKPKLKVVSKKKHPFICNQILQRVDACVRAMLRCKKRCVE